MTESVTAMQGQTRSDSVPKSIEELVPGAFDFLDFGCSQGGSIKLAQSLFGQGRGLGLDIDPAKVATAREAGYDAMVADLTDPKVRHNLVRYVMLSHFLEHLPGLRTAEQAVTSAVRAAREFVYIAQPWFDSDGYLFKHGLKVFWSDWHGHPNRMTSFDFHYILESLRQREAISGYRIFARDRIQTSRNSAVHPLASPRNQHAYDAKVHPPKPKRVVLFREPVYSEIQLLIDVQPNEALAGFRKKYPKSQCIFSSYD